jgi:hypothetical protein
MMNLASRHLTQLTALAATILGLVLVTAGQASAVRPEPEPAHIGAGRALPAPSVTSATDSPLSLLQWVLFVAVVIGALLVGAALTHLIARRRMQPAH